MENSEKLLILVGHKSILPQHMISNGTMPLMSILMKQGHGLGLLVEKMEWNGKFREILDFGWP